jgi:aldehyde:ferredoxin oxidoreductase
MLVGKLAKIDLDNGRIDLDPIAGTTLGGYLGGRGLNMRLLFPG